MKNELKHWYVSAFDSCFYFIVDAQTITAARQQLRRDGCEWLCDRVREATKSERESYALNHAIGRMAAR